MSALVDLVPTVGAAMIGVWISTAMYGLTTFQMWHYYQLSWNHDPRGLKIYVFFIWLLETAHAALCCSFIFRVTILNFGDPAALLKTHVSDDVTTGVTGLIIFSVHMFYVRRLWILSNQNILLVGVVAILAVGHFVFEMVVMGLTFVWPEFDEFHRITAYYTTSLALAATVDIIIATSLTYLLFTRKTGIRSTNTIVNRIVTYTITTGALTSVVDLAILICFVAMPNNLVYLSLFDFVPNLYANSMLSMLNARNHLQKLSAISTDISSGLALQGLNGRSDERRTGDSSSGINSKITFAVPTETVTTVDLA